MVVLLSLFLGTTLAAVAGLRAFLPLFLLGVLERAQLLSPFTIGENFQWLTSDLAVLTFGIATVFEIAADKIPGMDSLLDSVMTFLRPGAGALSVFAVLSSQDPTLAYVAGFVLAAGASLPVHLGKGFLRLGSHAVSGGTAGPALSATEDVAAVGAVTLSTVAPALAILFGGCSLLFALWLLRKLRRERSRA